MQKVQKTSTLELKREARIVSGCHPGCDAARTSASAGSLSPPSTGRFPPSHGSWEYLHEPELARGLQIFG